MSPLKVLFVGGTGIISSACAELAIERGMELYLLTRGNSARTSPAGAHVLLADVNNPEHVRTALRTLRFDVVVDWVAFTPADIARDSELFWDITGQYIFISSASAYQKPPAAPDDHRVDAAGQPLLGVLAQQDRLRGDADARPPRTGFPMTIVRPSHTYDTIVPVAVSKSDYTIIDRIRRGLPVIIHGEGTSLWTLTHADDFARAFLGLCGNPRAIGHAFHITSDEWLTWDQILRLVGRAAGAEPNLVHVPSAFIAKLDPDTGAGLLGDKSWCALFDNSKVKSFVPEFAPQMSFTDGARGIVAWHDADAGRRIVNRQLDATMDVLVDAYRPRTL